jgi:glycerol-3-phosphate dehydrogenase
MKVAVIGAGSWGTALAQVAARSGHDVVLWARRAEVADGVNAAAAGLVDDVIDPADSRKMVIAALEMLSSKRDSNPPKKHGNMPL